MPALVSGREAQYFDLFFLSGAIHYASAAILFGFLAWFALFVFTAIEPEQRKPNGRLTTVKFTRNAFYYLCGAIIIFCILAMALSALVIQFTSIDMSWWDRGNWTFWFEAIALVAFGTSWLVKGRFLGMLRDTA